MTSTARVTETPPEALSEQDQAFALWTFVHLKIPRFTSGVALEVVKNLAPQPSEVPKALAKRLRKALMDRGVAIKQTAALEAASRLLGHDSWHAANRTQPNYRLKLTPLAKPSEEEVFSNWRKLTTQLCAWCDAWLQQQGSSPLLEVSFAPACITVSVQVPKKANNGNDSSQSWPLLAVTPEGESQNWLEEASSAIETLRRHLEEAGKALLDGIAVFQLCVNDKSRWPADGRYTAQLDDICNSELVLMQEDNELDPAAGFEIARGDELTCWAQLELAATGDRGDKLIADVTVSDGAWIIGDSRFVWQLATLRPKDSTPGLILKILGQEDATVLWRRYRLARRLYPKGLAHRQVTKKLNYLGTLTETYRVNLHNLLLEMSKAGLTWETYCAETGEAIAMEPNLPVGFVLGLAQRLKLKDPNAVLARPNRSELSRVLDDSLLRTLMPRVDHVRYRLPNGLNAETKEVLSEAVGDFSASIRILQLTAGGVFVRDKNPLPYLVYASDAEELRSKLLEQGFTMYAGVMPRIIQTEGLPDLPQNIGPYALGNSLFLDIDFEEGAQQ